MKLIDLKPKWASYGLGERHGMGLSILCPVHLNHRLVVMFANPLDGLPPAPAKYLWVRVGETFEDLTLGPSIDASGALYWDNVEFPCWHGFIRNGEVT